MTPAPIDISRIALVLQSTAVGGMETHALDLATEYRRRDMSVTTFLPPGETFDGLAAKFEAAGARVVRLHTDARSGRRAQLSGTVAFARELRRVAPHAVHVHTGGATGGFAPVAIARAVSGATVAITEHDVPAPKLGWRQQRARRSLDRLAHAVVAVSRRNARIRNARLPVANRNFAVVLNGVPLPASAPERHDTRAELGLRADVPVIGSLVRLAEGKGLDTLLDAFALVRSSVCCKLLLVGDGPLRGALEERAADLGVSGEVIFAGHQVAPARFLEAMDVFCLAVPAGSMSIALLEAMALGLPPVITFGGPEEAVIDRETGLTPEPNDPRALAGALGELAVREDLRRDLGRAAAAHVALNYSVERVAGDLLDVFAGARTRQGIPPRLRANSPDDPRPGVSAASDHQPAG